MGIGHWTVDGERERERERGRHRERERDRKKERKKERDGERERKKKIIRYLQGQTPDGMNRFLFALWVLHWDFLRDPESMSASVVNLPQLCKQDVFLPCVLMSYCPLRQWLVTVNAWFLQNALRAVIQVSTFVVLLEWRCSCLQPLGCRCTPLAWSQTSEPGQIHSFLVRASWFAPCLKDWQPVWGEMQLIWKGKCPYKCFQEIIIPFNYSLNSPRGHSAPSPHPANPLAVAWWKTNLHFYLTLDLGVVIYKFRRKVT